MHQQIQILNYLYFRDSDVSVFHCGVFSVGHSTAINLTVQIWLSIPREFGLSGGCLRVMIYHCNSGLCSSHIDNLSSEYSFNFENNPKFQGEIQWVTMVSHKE